MSQRARLPNALHHYPYNSRQQTTQTKFNQTNFCSGSDTWLSSALEGMGGKNFWKREWSWGRIELMDVSGHTTFLIQFIHRLTSTDLRGRVGSSPRS